ncbi:MAG: hypothetical protein WEB85_14335 [Dongiaceae bacterium]
MQVPKSMAKNTTPGVMSRPLRTALELVEAIADTGLALVPAQPTAAMVKAGAIAGIVGPETAVRVYRAMVAAAD